MANSNLAILISAKLNNGLSLKSINENIKALAKHPSLQKLDLKVNIDKSFFDNLSSLSKNLNTITSQLQQQNIANNKVNTGLKQTTQSIQDQTKATNEAAKAESKWRLERERTNKAGTTTSTSTNGYKKQIVTTMSDGSNKDIVNIVDYSKKYKELENIDRSHYNALKDNKSRIEAMEKVHYLALQKNREMDWKNLQAANKQAEALDKAHYQAIKMNSDMIAKNQKQTQSLINSAFSGKQSANSASNGVAEAKALEVLNRQYDKVLSNLNAAKNSGKQLSDSELSGINRRIEALNNLGSRQRQVEKDRAVLSSTQLRAETQVNNLLSGKYKDKVDSEQLSNLLTRLKNLDVQTANFKGRAKEITDQINKLGSEARNASAQTAGLGDKLKQTFNNMLIYSGVGSIFYGAINAFKSGVQHIFDIDAAMTDLRKVTDETTLTYNRFLVTANETANAIGGVTVDVVKSTTEWARLGYTIQQAQSLAKQTLVYQNVGDIKSAEDASKSLISTIKGFGIEVDNEGKNITKIVDIYNEVGNKFAISSAGIGEALRRSAASLSEAGNSIEQSVALATAANSTIQDPARVGQMLKTVSMRLRGVSDEGEDLTDLIPSMEKKFAALGLTLKKDDNTFKSTYDIFKDLSSIWSDLSDFQRADILESVAGKLQGNIAASLINNFKDAQDSLITALNSTGSAARENEKYIESIAGRMNLFKNAISEFWSKSIESSTVKTVINSLTSVVDHIGSVNKALLIAGAAFIIFKQKAIASAIKSLYDFIGVLYVTTITTNGATLALNLLGKAITVGWIGVAAGAFYVLYNIINSSSKAIKEQNELIEKTDERYSDLNESLSETSNYYKQNYKDISTNNDVKDRMFQLQSQLIDSFGLEATGLDLVNGKYEDQIAKLEELNKKKLSNEIKDNEIVVNSINETRYSKPQLGAKLIGKGYSVQDGGGQGDTLSLKEYYEELLVVQDKIRNGNNDIYASEKLIPNTWKDKELALNAVADQMAKLEPSYKKILYFEDLQKESQKQYAAGLVTLSDEQKKFYDEVTGIASKQPLEDFGKYVQGLAVYSGWFTGKNAAELINRIENISQIKADPELLKLFENLKQGYIDAANAAEGASEVLTMHDALMALGKGLNGSSEQLNKFLKYITKSKDNVDELNKAQKELDDNGQLSAQTIKDLNDKYGDFIKKTGLSKDGIYKYIKATKDQENAAIDADIKITKEAIKNSEERLKQLKKEYDLLVNILNAKIDNATVDDLNTEKIFMQQTAPYRAAQKELDLLKTKYSILTQTQNDYNAVDEDSKKTKEKLNESYSDTVEILTELQKKMESINKLLDAESRKRSKLRKDSKEYQDSLRKENDLLKEKIKLGKDGINNPAKLVSSKVTTTTKTNDGPPSSSTSSSSTNNVGSGSSNLDKMLSNALGLQGSFKYKQVSGKFKGTYEEFVKGATSDCSQFVQEMFDEFLNINLPRTAAEQAKKGVAIEKADLKSGDLVFFNTTGKDNSHVGIYTSNGKFIQMGNSGLKESNLNSSYWSGKYQGARRVAESSEVSTTPASSGKSSIKNGNTTIKTDGPTQKELADAIDAQLKQNNDSEDKIYQNNLLILESFKEGFDRRIQEQEDILYESKRTQEKLDPHSAAWRKENEKQVNAKGNIQSIQHEAKTKLQTEMKALGIESNDWDDVLKKLSSDWLDIQSEKFALLIENFNSQIDSSKQRISDLDNLVEQSKNRMSQFDVGSPEYNKELNLQIELTKKQNKENENLRKSLETLANSTKLDPATRKQFKEMLDELNLKDYTSDIKDLNAELIASKATPLTKSIDDINHKLDVSKATLKGYKEGTEEYNKELKNQVALNNDLISATKKLKDYAEKQSQNEELSASVREDYKKQVKELTLSLYEYSDAIKEIRETYADNVIEKYKKMLTEQQKLRNAAYDKEKEAEDARHETRMSNLDDEMSKFEDVINAQTKSLDREVAGEDYADQLSKLQKEKSELDAKFSTLLLDDSLEAKSKRADLQKEIDAKAEEITKLQRDREITIRKEGLSDQLEDRKAAIDKAKKLEDDQNKSVLKGIEANKKLNDDYYDGLLNDEQYFYSMKQNLMSEDTVKIQNELTIVQSAYDTFFKELEKNSGVYASKIASNLKYTFGLDKDYANNFPSPTNNDGSSGSSGGKIETPVSSSKSQKQSDWEAYLSNKQKAEQIKTEMKTLVKDSVGYKNKQAEFLKLQAANEALRKQYSDFPDGSYADLSKLTKFHVGGIAGEKGTTTKSLLQDEEVPAILKKGEGIIDKPRDFFKEIASNVMNNLSNILSNFNTSKIFGGSLQPQAIDNSLSIRIDNVNGDKQGAKVVTDAIEEFWKKKTKSGW